MKPDHRTKSRWPGIAAKMSTATKALVLQGGGALGSYQAGVYEALFERDAGLDWIAGISIGAINAALIAGNAPADRPRGWPSSGTWCRPVPGRCRWNGATAST